MSSATVVTAAAAAPPESRPTNRLRDALRRHPTAIFGAVVLVPSLALLFGLFLGGRFDPSTVPAPPSADEVERVPAGRQRLWKPDRRLGRVGEVSDLRLGVGVRRGGTRIRQSGVVCSHSLS